MAKQMVKHRKKTAEHKRASQHMKPTHKKKRARARNPVTREPITDTVEVMEIEVVSGPDDPLQADELELSEDGVLLEDEE